MVGLCLSFLLFFLFSRRRTGGGVPSASRAMDLTAVVARNLRSFFFLGKHPLYARKVIPSWSLVSFVVGAAGSK